MSRTLPTLLVLAFGAPVGAQTLADTQGPGVQTHTLQECFTQFCFGPSGQCTSPGTSLLPGYCILHPISPSCLPYEFYAESCTVLADNPPRGDAGDGADRDACLQAHCFQDGAGQCDPGSVATVVDGACVLLHDTIDGRTYTLSAECQGFMGQAEPCETLRAAQETPDDDGGCAVPPATRGAAGAGLLGLAFLGLWGARRRRRR
ncbi:MAG: hypothetical protein H6702_17330 [Myxococcales bacterium]|nr:hypothetical protein [Myxococcales bacterium]